MGNYKCEKCGNETDVCEPTCSKCGAPMSCVCKATCGTTCTPECLAAGCTCQPGATAAKPEVKQESAPPAPPAAPAA